MSTDLSHLYPPTDPSDNLDVGPDHRTYPDKPPERLDGRTLEGYATEHANLTNCACACGWCAYYERAYHSNPDFYSAKPPLIVQATTDPFTTNENLVAAMASADRIAGASVLLDKATDQVKMAERKQTDDRYRNPDKLLRSAEVGALQAQASALLAVAFELAALRAEVRQIGDVAGAVRETGVVLEDRLDRLNDVLDTGLFDIANPLPSPRWWQFGRRRALREQTARVDFDAALAKTHETLVAEIADGNGEASELSSAQESLAEVREFVVEVRRDCPPWALASNEVLGRVRFYALPHAACDTADTMLPGLCAQLGTTANPERVHGLVYRCNPDGADDGYVGMVFLPGAAVAADPPGGF